MRSAMILSLILTISHLAFAGENPGKQVQLETRYVQIEDDFTDKIGVDYPSQGSDALGGVDIPSVDYGARISGFGDSTGATRIKALEDANQVRTLVQPKPTLQPPLPPAPADVAGRLGIDLDALKTQAGKVTVPEVPKTRPASDLRTRWTRSSVRFLERGTLTLGADFVDTGLTKETGVPGLVNLPAVGYFFRSKAEGGGLKLPAFVKPEIIRDTAE